MKVIRDLLKPLSFVPALCLMYMIFSFSAQDSVTSSALSYKVSYKIVETGAKVLGENLEPYQIDSLATRFHGLVRKIAHMTEYFALAVAVAFPLYVYGLRGIWLMLVAGFICVAFACGDEYHQSFVSGRSPSKRDVAIDSFGVFWGIILARIVGWTGRKTIFRPFSDEALQKRDEKKARKKQKKRQKGTRQRQIRPLDIRRIRERRRADMPSSREMLTVPPGIMNMSPIPEMLTIIQIVMDHIQTTAMKRHRIISHIRLHKADTRRSQEMTIISLSQALILIRVIRTDTHRIRKWMMMTTFPTSFPRICLSEN